MLPWLINLGRAVAGATGTGGVAKGAAKLFDPRKVPLKQGKRFDVKDNKIQGAQLRKGVVPNYLSQPGYGPAAIKMGLTGLGGSIALDRIGAMMGDDPEEIASPSQTRRFEKDTGQSLPDYSQGIQNRLDHQKKMTRAALTVN